MSMSKELETARAEAEEAKDRITALEEENTSLSEKLAGINESAEADKAEARADGEKAAIERTQARAEKFGADFALEHIAASDEDCQTAYIAKLESEKDALAKQVAEKEVGFDTDGTAGDEDGSTPKTYEEERQRLMSEGMTARDAAVQDRKKFKSK